MNIYRSVHVCLSTWLKHSLVTKHGNPFQENDSGLTRPQETSIIIIMWDTPTRVRLCLSVCVHTSMLAPCKLITYKVCSQHIPEKPPHCHHPIIPRRRQPVTDTLQLILRFLLFRSTDFAHSHSQNHIIVHIILFIIQTLHYVAEIHLSTVSKDTFGGHNAWILLLQISRSYNLFCNNINKLLGNLGL